MNNKLFGNSWEVLFSDILIISPIELKWGASSAIWEACAK